MKQGLCIMADDSATLLVAVNCLRLLPWHKDTSQAASALLQQRSEEGSADGSKSTSGPSLLTPA